MSKGRRSLKIKLSSSVDFKEAMTNEAIKPKSTDHLIISKIMLKNVGC